MEDICLCGHGRPQHALGFQHCESCADARTLSEIRPRFVCRPGLCDRFTWDPKRETAPAPKAK